MHVVTGGLGPGEAVRTRARPPGAPESKRRSRSDGIRRAKGGSGLDRPLAEGAPRVGAGPTEICILDGDGRILVVNQAWRKAVEAFGLPLRDAGVGSDYVDVACVFLPDLDRAGLEDSLHGLLSGAVDDVSHTYAIQTPAGARWRHVQIAPLSVGDDGRFVAIHDDQTELAAAQEALKVTSEQLLTARDEERQRIALELHDSTSQHLAAISLNLARLRRTARRDGMDTAILDEISRSVSEAVKETRVLSYLMKPRGLGRNGLAAAVLDFLEGFARRTGLEVALEAEGGVDSVPAPLQHAALRIVQEALLNANRHAHARRVTVELGVDQGLLKVSITDDGRGMPSDQAAANLGVGIPGMQARAQQFAGDLAISSDETGTRVVALLPLP